MEVASAVLLSLVRHNVAPLKSTGRSCLAFSFAAMTKKRKEAGYFVDL